MSIESLQESVEREFVERFGRPASVVVAAPGRVNLIGEHIDYNDGVVLPLAIDRYVLIAADRQPNDSPVSSIRLHSQEFGETETIVGSGSFCRGSKGWQSYVGGVLFGFAELGERLHGFDAVIGSSVPLGSGLSSSAALEVAMATLVEELTGCNLSQYDKAVLCQKAEHDFAGVPCGIMDQFSSVFGRPDELMFIDCRSGEIEPVSFDTREVSLLITNSNVKHTLNQGAYALRRQQCASALKKTGHDSWRDVSIDEIERLKFSLELAEYRRARHVVLEIDRTFEATRAVQCADWNKLGKLMFESHGSLRDDFEVSCHEMDVLVKIARDLGVAGGVMGSRMTGGGFGGCTVSLVANDKLGSVINAMVSRYKAETGITADCFPCRPSLGAHVLIKNR